MVCGGRAGVEERRRAGRRRGAGEVSRRARTLRGAMGRHHARTRDGARERGGTTNLDRWPRERLVRAVSVSCRPSRWSHCKECEVSLAGRKPPSSLARAISVVYADLRENCLAAAGHLPIVGRHGDGPVGKRHRGSWPGRLGAPPVRHGMCGRGRGMPPRFATGATQPLRELVSLYGPRARGQEVLRWRVWYARMAARRCGP